MGWPPVAHPWFKLWHQMKGTTNLSCREVMEIQFTIETCHCLMFWRPLYLRCPMWILSGRFCFLDNYCLGDQHVRMLLLGFLYRNSEGLWRNKLYDMNVNCLLCRVWCMSSNEYSMSTFKTTHPLLYLWLIGYCVTEVMLSLSCSLLTCSWSTSSSPVIMILFSILVSE